VGDPGNFRWRQHRPPWPLVTRIVAREPPGHNEGHRNETRETCFAGLPRPRYVRINIAPRWGEGGNSQRPINCAKPAAFCKGKEETERYPSEQSDYVRMASRALQCHLTLKVLL
jgi:hypothetical protein